MTRTAILALFAAAGAALALGAGAAGAAPSAASARTINVVMHDPGCHWFAVGKGFKKALTVKGATTLKNLDEATLIVKGAGVSTRLRVGTKLTLTKRGGYTITMVGQTTTA